VPFAAPSWCCNFSAAGGAGAFMNNIQLDLLSEGDTVKCWCKCGAECQGRWQTFADGKKHAKATCPKCGLTNFKRTQIASLDDIGYILKGLEMKLKAILSNGDTLNYDEGVCMVERFAKQMLREDNESW